MSIIPDNPQVWIVLIIVAGCVLALAIWLGRFVSLKKDGSGISLQVNKEEDPASKISVANRLEMTGGEAGDIAGIKSEKPEAGPSPNIDVLEKGKLRNAKVGDIVGVKQTGNPPDKKT